jgi:tetratricopeptide (TPR) repeat protein
MSEELLLLSHRLGDSARDWVIPGEGSAAIRLDDSTFAMTAEQASLGSISPAELVTLSFSPLLEAVLGDDPLTSGEIEDLLLAARQDQRRPQPPEEAFLHAYLLTLPDVLLVGHTYSEAISGLLCSAQGWEVLKKGGRLTPSEVVHCGVAPCCVSFAKPGIELARAVRSQTESYLQTYQCSPKTIYLQNQGFIALGGLAGEVERTTAVADKAARIMARTLLTGTPAFLAPESVASIAQSEPVRTLPPSAAPEPAKPPLDIAAKEPAAPEEEIDPGKDLKAAIARYRREIEAKPKNAKAHYNLGLALFSQGKLDESIEALKKAVSLKPKDVDAKVNLGVALAQKERWDEALKELNAALTLAPDDGCIHYNLGQTYLGMHQADKAVMPFREAIRLDPADPEAHLGLANALFIRGRVDDAIAEYNEALRRDSHSADAHYYLACALTSLGKEVEAIGHYKDAARLDPKNSAAHIGLADAYRADKRFDDAIGEYQEALFLDQNSRDAYYGFGCALIEKGTLSKSATYWDTARDAFGRALTIAPNHAPSLTGLAQVEMHDGHNQAAADALHAAIQADPEYAPAHESLAKLQMQMGKWRDAWRTKRSAPARREKKGAAR